MEPRINIASVSPDAYRAVAGIQRFVDNSGLERSLRELIKLRASQINGCAYCLDMHWKDARANGETEQRLYSLDAWRETPFYNERERAALALTEAVTLVSRDHVPDEVYKQAQAQFSEAEMVDLVMAIVAINTWNRLAITFRTPPGTYQPATAKKAS
jgi:AhpD family alkylhydroperoxidase